MTEATWGDGAVASRIDWRMSASLENVPRGDGDLAEVTSLRGAVLAWRQLDSDHKAAAVLTPERVIQIGGVATASFSGASIATLVDLLPAVGAVPPGE